MGNELTSAEVNKLERYYTNVCKSYGVTCKVLTRPKHAFSSKEESFLVFGINGVPEHLDVKEIYIRNERSNSLFYTDYFVVKIDEDTSVLGLVDAAVSYCKTVKFLKDLYAEHKTPLTRVIRGDEIGGLKEHNIGRKNKRLSPEQRAKFNAGIKKFFKQENTKIKYFQKWRAFSRSDKFDRKALVWKMFFDFHKRNSQITELALLHETNDDLKTTVINEHEFRKFKEIMQREHPDVLYAVSEREIQNEGFNIKRDKRKPIHKIKAGPIGKLITYEAYCAVVEKRFAAEGYDGIKDLNPAYYETRQLTYKEIDEPYVAGVLNSIRFAYAKSNSLQSVKIPDVDIVSYVDIPVGDMMNFVSLAKANHVPFYLDFYSKFSNANFETIRVVYSPAKDEMMKSIVKRMVNEKFQLSHISTELDQGPSLDKKIVEARHVQLSGPEAHNHVLENGCIEP